MPIPFGARLGPYEVVALLGAGGMGEVYRARDTKLGREVALKILPDAFASEPDRLARFHREAQVLAALNHPNIGAIHGFEEFASAISPTTMVRALVLELVDGPTLAERIAQGSIPVDEALPIARQIADALDAAHEHGIVHRDLKPANIKVRPDGAVKVLDFGLAKPTAASAGGLAHSPVGHLANSFTIMNAGMATSPGIVLGTAAYMSPEQAKGLEVDRTTDVWAFGCVLYEMLAGRPAFAGATTAEVLSEILRSEPDWTGLPRETPASIRRLLRRCLRKDRRDIPPVVDMSSLTPPLIAVCVATYHRPALLDLLLASLKAIEVPKGCAVECRIVDNDKAGSARETAERWAAAGTLPGKLRYEIEPTQGISAARNHALDMGPADLIAYIDDDEVASPRWLAELVATLDRTGADAVFGPVVARFLEGTPGWMIRGGFYDKQVRREGSPLEWNETRTSNALVRGEWFFAKGLRYAPEYGRTGGEDTQLFARMEVDGARYAASALAIVSEEVHRDRMRVRWLLRTSWLRTLTYHRTLENHSKGRRLPLGLLAVLRVARATALCLASLPFLLVGRQEHFWRAMTRWAVACAGIHYWLRPGRARDYVAYGPSEGAPTDGHPNRTARNGLALVVGLFWLPLLGSSSAKPGPSANEDPGARDRAARHELPRDPPDDRHHEGIPEPPDLRPGERAAVWCVPPPEELRHVDGGALARGGTLRARLSDGGEHRATPPTRV